MTHRKIGKAPITAVVDKRPDNEPSHPREDSDSEKIAEIRDENEPTTESDSNK